MRRLESGLSVDNELFSDMVRYEHETISGTTITNSNVGSPIFWGCNLDHLVFDTCDLTNARFFAGCTMDHCTFIRSDLRSVGMAKDEAVFTNCEFSSCDLRGMTLENATFIDCSFVKCRFNDRILQAAKIVNCSFTGKLVDITFEGNGRQKLIANFENCILDGVRFVGCDLTQCIPPKAKNHLYVEQVSARVKKALKEIDDDLVLSDDERKILSRSLRKLESMEQYMFNTAHMKKIYGEVFVERFFCSLGVWEASSEEE
ncbi:pentapeptide repeat-containing protein [Paenibacillus barcinonensis]|uniref:pentapeptide repeat-containing protein n=1 Tax=Paenibacillus barcinonensis TaxID=198119 RepID=UPI001C108177|nr:pentapeptide repeat-containing protein [Paenibacillus barcinonensis]MBU5355511.1 pentapeptide repeat-containing protein [Paenibacillus barcinonensis]